MVFGKKRATGDVREGAMTHEQAKEKIKELNIHDIATVERIDWDGSISVISGKVSHVHFEHEDFTVVEEDGDYFEFHASDGDISKIEVIPVGIEIDEGAKEQYLTEDGILELMGALDIGDKVSISFYDDVSGKGAFISGDLTIKDEYNKVFGVVQKNEDGTTEEKHFNIGQDKIIEILMV